MIVSVAVGSTGEIGMGMRLLVLAHPRRKHDLFGLAPEQLLPPRLRFSTRVARKEAALPPTNRWGSGRFLIFLPLLSGDGCKLKWRRISA